MGYLLGIVVLIVGFILGNGTVKVVGIAAIGVSAILHLMVKVLIWHNGRMIARREEAEKLREVLDLVRKYVSRRDFFQSTPVESLKEADKKIITQYVHLDGLPEELLVERPELKQLDKEVRRLYSMIMDTLQADKNWAFGDAPRDRASSSISASPVRFRF